MPPRARYSTRVSSASRLPTRRRPVRVALDHPQARPQLEVQLVAFVALPHQPCGRLCTRHGMHRDILRLVAAAGSDACEAGGAHEGDAFVAHARRGRAGEQHFDVRRFPAGFLYEFASCGVLQRVLAGLVADQPGRHLDRAPAQRDAHLLDEQHLVPWRDRDDDHRHAVGVGAFHVLPAPALAQPQPLAFVDDLRVAHAAASCNLRRVCGPKRMRSHNASSAAASAAPRAKAWSCSSGASQAMVVSRRHSNAMSRCSRSLAATDAAPRKRRKGISSIRSSNASRVSKCDSNTAAVLAPTPGTPGMLSTASPHSARKSATWCACTPWRDFTPAAPQRTPRAKSHCSSCSSSSCDRSLSAETITPRRPNARAWRSALPIRSSASYSGWASVASPRPWHRALQCANWRLSSSGAGSRLAL